jgi:hypothetical protein
MVQDMKNLFKKLIEANSLILKGLRLECNCRPMMKRECKFSQ